MAISNALRQYLDRRGLEYEVLLHPHTATSLQTARAAHIPSDQLIKSILLEDERGYLLVVIPASHRLQLDKLNRQLDRRLDLASENELGDLFSDCEVGAVPAVGEAYGIEVAMDDSLSHTEEVYFEAGDHMDVVHMRGTDFQALMADAPHGVFSQHW